MTALQTPRLRLRPLEPRDADFLVEALNNKAVWEWLSVIPMPYTKEHAMDFIEGRVDAGENWLIEKEGTPQGVIGLRDELGYWLDERAWGQGIVTEAALAVLLHAFANPDCQSVKSGHFNANTRSKNALEKLGFKDTGAKMLGCISDGRTDIPSRSMELSRADFERQLEEVATERLTLRRIRPSDFEALHSIVSQWNVVRQLGSWPYPSDRDHSRKRAVPFAGEGDIWAICQNDTMIGSVGVNVGSNGPGVGYMLDPAHHGKGLMTEAVTGAISHGFARYDWDKIEAQTWHDNAGSDAVLRKLGFIQVGTTREMSKPRGEMTDSRTYILTRAAWAQAHPLCIKSERLTLRAISAQDAPELRRALGRPEIAAWLHSIKAPWSPEDCDDWIEKARWIGGPDFRLSIETNGRLIGSVGLVGGTRAKAPSLTYAIAPEAMGQGYATEACIALLKDAFPRFGLNHISTNVLTDNQGSIKVLEKLGFERIGEAFPSPALAPRMDYAYRLTRQSFEARHEIS